MSFRSNCCDSYFVAFSISICFGFGFVQIFRCALRRSPSSSLADDCITAMSEGLCSAFYNYFLARLWGDGDSAYLSEADAGVDSEWESYSSVIMRMRTNYILTPERRLDSMSHSSWDFLINSKFQGIIVFASSFLRF